MTEPPPRMVYLDHAADTPLCAAARQAMEPLLSTLWGSASSLHQRGRHVRALVETAREQVAAMAGCEPDEVAFTSGATEAINWAVKAGSGAATGAPGGILASPIEHEAALASCAWAAAHGSRLTWMPVERDGRAVPGRADPCGGVALVVLMAANNETGVVQPVAEAAEVAARLGARLVIDAVQAAPWGLCPFRESGADLMALSAHKFGGPQGVGALLIRRGFRLDPWMHGGRQEQGLRAGTLNNAGIVGMGAAAAGVVRRAAGRGAVAALRDRLQAGLVEAAGAVATAPGVSRLPGHLHMSVPGIQGEALVEALSDGGVCASAGAACGAGTTEVSHVLRAMGMEEGRARGAVRFTLGPETTAAEVAFAVGAVAEAVRGLRRLGAAKDG